MQTGYALEWRVGTWWSGGDYGPEGYGCLAATVVAAAIFMLLPKLVPEKPEAEGPVDRFAALKD